MSRKYRDNNHILSREITVFMLRLKAFRSGSH